MKLYISRGRLTWWLLAFFAQCLLLKMFSFIQATVKMCISTHSIYSANNSVAAGRTHTDPKCAREKNGSGKRVSHVKVCAWVHDVVSAANHLK